MIQEDYRIMRDKMCDILHITERQFLQDKHYPAPYARAIVADALRQMGFKWASIGLVMGRDHSTFVFMCKKMNENLENPSFRLVKRIYDKFYNE